MSAWIEWDGKGCPVRSDVRVDVKFRGGAQSLEPDMALWYSWRHLDCSADIVAYRIVEPAPDAHMMSAPITVRVVLSQREPVITFRPQGVQVDTVTITRAEHDALTAEVERLNAMVEDMCKQDYERFLEIERLRKGKDDEQKCDRSHMVGEARPDLPKHPQAPSLAMVADTLDHRLGTPQPDGEPCEPMSARRWRWLP